MYELIMFIHIVGVAVSFISLAVVCQQKSSENQKVMMIASFCGLISIVGNHTVNHKSMPDLSDEEMKKEIMQLNQSLYEKFGYEMKYLRPPKGEFSERSLKITDSLGFKTVMWSFAYVDWNEDSQPLGTEAIQKITSNLHNGEIMLLHATSKTNSEIMRQMIQETRSQGYEFKSLDEFKE